MIREFAVLISICVLVPSIAGQAAAQPTTKQPSWLTVGAQIRGRAERFTGVNYVPGNSDGYYLHRLRFHAAFEPSTWFRFFAQAQDSQAPGLREPVPSSAANTLDLRQAYVEFGSTTGGSWAMRFGRQELLFGEERLVGALNWGNVSRTFDAARLTYRKTGVQLDWFASAVVVPINGRFDHPQTANKFYGLYSSFDKLVPNSVIQPYFFWKTGAQTLDERGDSGDLDVYTAGLRTAGKLPQHFDYNLELAFQSGHAARDDIRAWAGHWQLGFSPWPGNWAPRFVAEFNRASGDGNPGDGRRGTFDQLFPTNHSKYGIADRVGWRNMRDLMAGIELKPARQWKFNVDCHSFWLATRHDALYNSAGVSTVRNLEATSNHVGSEIDFQATYSFSPQLQLGFGFAHLFAGEFLRQSTSGSSVSFPYLMWNYTL